MGAEFLVIGPGDARQAAAVAERLRTPFPVLADPTGIALDRLGCTPLVGSLRYSGSLLVDAQGRVRAVRRSAVPALALRWPADRRVLEALCAEAAKAGL